MYQSHMLINAEPVASLSGKVEIIRNPANQEPVAEVSVGSRQDACIALQAAKKAFPIWSQTLQPEESRDPACCCLPGAGAI